MEDWEKDIEKLKLAVCFRKILKSKKDLSETNKSENIEDIHLVASMRQLEADSGISFTLIQSLCAGKRDVQFTSIVRLLKSLKTSFSEFAAIYDDIKDKDLNAVKNEINQSKNNKSVKKKSK